MFELTIMIALLLLAAGIGAYVHHRGKKLERARRQHYDEFMTRRGASSAIRGYSRSASSRGSDPLADPLHPLNPISPFNPVNHLNNYNDDSSTRSYSCDSPSSWSSSDSGSSSSSDSGSSSSSCD